MKKVFLRKKEKFDICQILGRRKKIFLFKDQVFYSDKDSCFIIINNVYTIRKLRSEYNFISDENLYEISIFYMFILKTREIADLRNFRDESFLLYKKDFKRLCNFMNIKKIIELPRIEINMK